MLNERNKAEQEHFSPKKIQENVFLLNWKGNVKIQALLKEKIFTWKSHLRPSCTKPFNFWHVLGFNPLGIDCLD